MFVIKGADQCGGSRKKPVADAPELGVYMLRASARWEFATHPLGEMTNALQVGHYEKHTPGHSPRPHFTDRRAAAL